MKNVTVVASLGLVGMACASPSGATRVAVSDLRGNAAVSDRASRLIVTGPMQLLHANYDRRAGVVFFKAAQEGLSAPDCQKAAPLGWDGESDLVVGEGEAICVSAARNVHLSWHARAGVVQAPKEVQHASSR
jgi:hypothetical protein